MKRILLIGISFLFLNSCIKDYLSNGRIANKLQLLVSVQGVQTGALTRTTVNVEEGEDIIGSLYLLFFEPNAYRNGLFVDYVVVEMPPSGAMSMNVETEIDISGTLLDLNNAYNILAIANIADDAYLDDEVKDWLEDWEGMTEGQAMFAARAYVRRGLPVTSDRLLMHGRFEKVAGRTQINLLLTRNHARLDVYNNVRTVYDLVSASVWNSYPSSSIWGEGVTDWSHTAPRIRDHYGVDNHTNEDGSDLNGPILGDIRGGLYVFENQSITPEPHDLQTTCLIIGLRKRDDPSATVTYYRANIHPQGNMQLLRRNHAYGLTIRSVSGPGAVTEELAYIGQGDSLEYSIGNWNLDDNGLIISDDFSILSLPTKMVNIGRELSVSTFSIYTFTTLSDAQGLSIRSQTYTPTGNSIRARLDGNTLVIEADPLGLDETERRGVVVLSFAGLENSISIYQSGTAGDYLRVHLPDGGIPRFPYFAGLFSGVIRVEASDFWTAKLYMNGFSFGPQLDPMPRITTLRSTDGLVDNHRFRVYTHSMNDGSSARDAFIVVTLDKNPDNYSSVIRLSQANASALRLTPEQTIVTFTGVGALANLGGISNVNTFEVNSGITSGTINFWSAEIITPSGSVYDDTGSFRILDKTNSIVPNGSPSLYHATDLSSNVVKVEAVGLNSSGRQQVATLRIYLVGDPDIYTDVTLVQQPLEFTFNPPSASNIPVTGGQTQAVTIHTDPSQTWSATIATHSGTVGGRMLVNHQATLVAENGSPIIPGTDYPLSTRFRVVFPKVYYPNREIPISATVTVTLSCGLTDTYTVTQSLLTGGLRAQGYGGGDGALVASATNNFAAYINALRAIPGYSFISNVTNFNTAVNANTTYLHVSTGGLSGSTSWTAVNNFRTGRDALTTYIASDDNSSQRAALTNAIGGLGYGGITNDSYSGTARLNTNSAVQATKIFRFLTTNGYAVQMTNLSNVGFPYNTDRQIFTSVPNNGSVPVITAGGTGNYIMAVDPKNRLIVIGNTLMFNNISSNADAMAFLNNLMFYVANAARYGSHFTDLLLEANDSANQPAPWDSYWNAGTGGTAVSGTTDNRGVTLAP